MDLKAKYDNLIDEAFRLEASHRLQVGDPNIEMLISEEKLKYYKEIGMFQEGYKATKKLAEEVAKIKIEKHRIYSQIKFCSYLIQEDPLIEQPDKDEVAENQKNMDEIYNVIEKELTTILGFFSKRLNH